MPFAHADIGHHLFVSEPRRRHGDGANLSAEQIAVERIYVSIAVADSAADLLLVDVDFPVALDLNVPTDLAVDFELHARFDNQTSADGVDRVVLSRYVAPGTRSTAPP